MLQHVPEKSPAVKPSSAKQKLLSKTAMIKVILLIALVAVAVINAPPAAKMVFNSYVTSGNRKLPIYSVDTPDKKISISFDAAWGEG